MAASDCPSRVIESQPNAEICSWTLRDADRRARVEAHIVALSERIKFLQERARQLLNANSELDIIQANVRFWSSLPIAVCFCVVFTSSLLLAEFSLRAAPLSQSMRWVLAAAIAAVAISQAFARASQYPLDSSSRIIALTDAKQTGAGEYADWKLLGAAVDFLNVTSDSLKSLEELSLRWRNELTSRGASRVDFSLGFTTADGSI